MTHSWINGKVHTLYQKDGDANPHRVEGREGWVSMERVGFLVGESIKRVD